MMYCNAICFNAQCELNTHINLIEQFSYEAVDQSTECPDYLPSDDYYEDEIDIKELDFNDEGC